MPLSDSASLRVIDRDDHDGSPWTAPNKRLHLQPRPDLYKQYQVVMATLRVVHNHPSGDPTPSQADIQMTKSIVAISAPLGISVHDHIIVGKNGHSSLKGMRLM